MKSKPNKKETRPGSLGVCYDSATGIGITKPVGLLSKVTAIAFNLYQV